MASSQWTDEEDNYYWQEVQEISDAKDPDGDAGSEDELESKTPDEAEEAADWLKSAGYGHIAEKVIEGTDIDDDLIDSIPLTKAQKVTVRRRINTLRDTLHKKNKHCSKTDVRDIFFQPGAIPGPKSVAKVDSVFPDNEPLSRSPPGQLIPRGLAVHKRREYNVNNERQPQPDAVGIETISIQLKDVSGRSASSSGSDDNLVSPHSHISMPLLNSMVDVSLGMVPGRFTSSQQTSSSLPINSVIVNTSQVPALFQRRTCDYVDGLPPIKEQPDNLGVTHIDDLSVQDGNKLRPLVLLELTTLLDHYHITFIRRKPKRRYKDTGVFGVPIQVLLDQDQRCFKMRNLTVPLFFEQLITLLCKEGIEEEGILRVPGSVSRIKALRKEIDETFNSGTFQWSTIRPNDAAGLLKLWLRELPIPLLTFEYVDAFAQVEQISDLRDRIVALNLLILLLPSVNRNTLKMLLAFFKKVIDHQGNLMTLNNVAMIMAPNLFLVKYGRMQNKESDINNFMLAAGTSNIVRLLIFYQHLLWIVPTTMIEQLRHQNEVDQSRKSRDKPFIRLLKKDKPDVYKKINDEENFNRNVIRVKVPSMNKFNTAIKLDPDTKAGDIVSRCLQDIAGPQYVSRSKERPSQVQNVNGTKGKSGSGLKESYLYEVGGNIGERKLDPSAMVLEVFKRNPNAEWIIRSESQNIC